MLQSMELQRVGHDCVTELTNLQARGPKCHNKPAELM